MRRRSLARAAAAAALALLALVAILVARDPVFWKRSVTLLFVDGKNPPAWFYEPRERIEGRDGGRLPRLSPAEAHVDAAALESAAEYAAARNSHALLVARGGELIFDRYFGGSEFTTLENAGAFNKTIAALAVGIALGEHRIRSLEQPAAVYLTEWRDDARREITIRDLLQMSSGLEETESSHEFLGTDIASASLGRRLGHRAGVDWSYQDVDARLLALIVERATGERYAKWLSEKLWKPIGAGDAFLWLDRPGGTAHAECCLLARQGDWMRIAQLLLDDGVYEGSRILPAGWVRAMLAPARGNPNFGFQVWLGSPYVPQRPYSRARRAEAQRAAEAYAADDVFFLDGYGKYRLWLVPSLGLAILRTGASPTDPADWDDSRIPNLIIRGVSAPLVPAAGRPLDLSKLVPGH